MKRLLAVALSILLSLLPVSVLADAVTVSANVQKYIEVTFSYDAVSYGNLASPSTNTSAPTQANGVYNVTVDTNYAYNVRGSGTDFDDGGGHTFDVENLLMDTNTNKTAMAVTAAKVLTVSPATIDSYVYTDTLTYHGFWLSIPAAQYAGSYSSTVTVTYENQ